MDIFDPQFQFETLVLHIL